MKLTNEEILILFGASVALINTLFGFYFIIKYFVFRNKEDDYEIES